MNLFEDIVKHVINENMNNFHMYAKFVDNDPSKGTYCYHCTPKKKGITKSGLRRQYTNSGAGNMYGDGCYTTYTLKSSQNNWNKYAVGEDKALVKLICHDDLRHFIIFDPNVCIQVHGKMLSIEDQLKYIFKDKPEMVRLFTNNSEFGSIASYFKNAKNDSSERINYTSVGARQMWELISYLERRHYDVRGKYIRGLIYSGQNDGNCLIAYNFASVEPIAYSLDCGRTFKPIDTDSWEHTELLQGNEDLAHYLKHRFDYFRTEGFVNGYAVVGKNGKFKILNQDLFKKNGDGSISNFFFDKVDGMSFNIDGQITVTYNGVMYIIKAINAEQYAVYSMNGQYLCPLRDLPTLSANDASQTHIVHNEKIADPTYDIDVDSINLDDY